jgi:UDP-3-O-[3-hydroxymyristoyl] glucosamine N-acyltransferase
VTDPRSRGGAGERIWAGGVRLRETTLGHLAETYGGIVLASEHSRLHLGRISPLEAAGKGDLAPLLLARFVAKAAAAVSRGAVLLIFADLARDPRVSPLGGWVHPCAAWAMACVLEEWALVPVEPPLLGRDVLLGAHVELGPRVSFGDRVTIGPSSVIGGAGFGWVTGPDGRRKRVPHFGGVVLEDDVTVGPLCTIDAGVLSPTIIRRGVHIDAQVHVAHNCEVGEETFVAAQSGFAGSVKIGRGVLVGGQVGVADHVTVGDGARIAAKSGVIGDIPSGATVAGYPAVRRARWLRGLGELYRSAKRGR